MTALLGHAGRGAIRALAAFLRISTLILDTLHWTFVAPLRHKGLRVRATIEQFVIIGFEALPIITLICLLLGAILAMQSASQLRNFGVDYLVPDLVAVAAMRELSPLMTAILVTGRSGSSFTAEIGTMKVSEEIDALDENRQQINDLLGSAKELSSSADRLVNNVDDLVTDNREKIDALLVNTQEAVAKVNDMMTNVKELIVSLQGTLERNSPEFDNLFVTLNNTLRNLEELTRTLADQPQSLIRGKEPVGRQ